MNELLQDVMDDTSKTLGLNHHALRRYHFFREKNHFNETMYILSMEWFPEDSEEIESDHNPKGTAVVDVNFHTKSVRRIVFVEGENSGDHSLFPSSSAKENIIEWIEDMTGLTFGRQFLIASESDHTMAFGAAVDNIPVSPAGTIRVEFNDDGVLTLFSVDGEFPNEDQIAWEPFALTPEKYEPVARKQCQLLELPDHEQEKWVPIYGVEEIFLTNDAARTIPFTYGDVRRSFVTMDKVLHWEEPLEGQFEQKDIDLSPEVDLETVLANQPHPDTFPLSGAEVQASEQEVLRFMRLVYPNESGKRRLTGLYLKDGYIVAEIKPVQNQIKNVLDTKIKLLIERETLTAVNYIDQEKLYATFNHFATAEKAVVSCDEAFDKLRKHIEMDPVYVYDSENSRYIMCGKLDCVYGVNAATGDVVALNDLF